MRVSIRFKFTVVLLLFALASLLFFGYGYSVVQKVLQKRIGQELERQSVNMLAQLDDGLYQRFRAIQEFSDHEIFIDVLNDDAEGLISEFLTTIRDEQGIFAELIYANNAGKVIAASNPDLIGQSVQTESWFRNAIAEQQPQAEGLSHSKYLNSQVLTFAVPSETEQLLARSRLLSERGYENQSMLEALGAWRPEVLGVMAGFLNWSEIIEYINTTPILDQVEHNEHAYALLIDREGQVITQPFFESEAVMFHQNLNELGLMAAQMSSQGETGYTIERGRFGHDDFVGYTMSQGIEEGFEGFGWSLLVFQNKDVALAPIRPLLLQMILIGLGLFLGVVVVSFGISRGLTRPLVRLVELTKLIAKGDFKANVQIKSADELGLLASSFNDMAQTLDKTKTDLIQATEYADNIIRSTADAMFVTTSEGLIEKCNPAVTELLKYEESELIGKPLKFLLEGEQVPENDIVKRVRISGLFSSEMEYKTKEGNVIPMLISANRMKDAEGNEKGIVVVAKDITDFKSLEQQFQRAQRMDAVGRLAGGIAHDFNNMLTIILGYGDKMLRKMGDDDPRGGEVGQIVKAGKRAAGLVRQLLTFSRRQIVKPVILDLNELVTNMHKMIRHMMAGHVEVVALLGENIWPVKIDPGQFEQVIANLCVNARDAMPDGGKVVLKTENFVVDAAYAKNKPGMKTGEYVILSCEDNGTGMTEEVKKKVFEPFFTTKGKDKGTGLGLATCYGMVKQAGGYTDVESELGKGTTFKLYLPKSEGTVESLSESETLKELPRGTETILLAEDEELIRELTSGILREQGYKVITASNGSEALHLDEENKDKKIDLLLTDVVMPKMGGRELAERIAKTRPEIKILYMSGYADDDFLQSGTDEASRAFLPKPITPITLTVKVREILDQKHEAKT